MLRPGSCGSCCLLSPSWDESLCPHLYFLFLVTSEVCGLRLGLTGGDSLLGVARGVGLRFLDHTLEAISAGDLQAQS